jgi:hypothetical protein
LINFDILAVHTLSSGSSGPNQIHGILNACGPSAGPATTVAIRVATSQVAMAVVAVTRIHIVGLTQAFDFLITHVANVYKSRHH